MWGLPHDANGTPMSRFVEDAGAASDAARSRVVCAISPFDAGATQGDDGSHQMRFPHYIRKTAPVSGAESLLDYHAG